MELDLQAGFGVGHYATSTTMQITLLTAEDPQQPRGCVAGAL